MSPGLYSRSLCDKEEEEEEQAFFQLAGVAVKEGRGMPVKQHVQEIGGQEGGRMEEEEEGGSAPVTLAVLCRSEGSRDSGERSLSLYLVTPGSGRGRPFCSRWRWGPGTSTHPVCRTTLGKESPERRKKTEVSVREKHFWADMRFRR